ncbi:hypothetical protein ACLB1T_00495 [Escherichia coli]
MAKFASICRCTVSRKSMPARAWLHRKTMGRWVDIMESSFARCMMTEALCADAG